MKSDGDSALLGRQKGTSESPSLVASFPTREGCESLFKKKKYDVGFHFVRRSQPLKLFQVLIKGGKFGLSQGHRN